MDIDREERHRILNRVIVIAGEREKGSLKDIEHREEVREKLAASKLLFCRSVSQISICIYQVTNRLSRDGGMTGCLMVDSEHRKQTDNHLVPKSW